MLLEIKEELIAELGLEENSNGLNQLVEGDSRYIRDLKLNVNTALDAEHLTAKEAHLIGLAIAVNNKSKPLTEFFKNRAKELEASDAEIAEAIACASLMSANNILYRFRHFANSDKYQNMPARMRMNIMAKPVLGKELFELISLAVSAVNGCEACVKSHETSVINLGSDEQRIFDAIRIASVITSLDKVTG